ncbi:MAG: prolyl oligopeptidase family serine peptidase, partial [Anaerolineaceae bacterium]|jgi:dipeptidyl aminopeptidase/acylaminoacyl peptidase
VVEVQSGQCFPILNLSDIDYDTGRFSWSPDSSSLLVTLFHEGQKQVRVVRLKDRLVTWSYTSETILSAAFSPQGDRVLCICSDELLWFTYPDGTLLQRLSLASAASVWKYYTGAQIGFNQRATTVYFVGANSCLYRWNIGGNCECILQDNSPAKPPFTHEAYRVPSRDGRLIPVQRFIPPHLRLPAILYIHGGPGVAIDPNDPFMLRLLAEGVECVCVAYRGSSGYGQEHEEANRGEYGRADVWDILAAGSDWKKRTGEDRPLIIAGYSYGGFLTLLSLAQVETPWVGGIAMWPVSGIHRFTLHRQRALPADPAQQALAMVERSPLEQARHIRVPLLLFHGALDTTATIEEMESIQHSIVSWGGVCELVVFDDDTHGLMRHRDEIHARVLSFLNQFE